MHDIKIKHNGCEIEVHYSVQPAEPENGIQGAYIDDWTIIYKGVDVTELLEPQIEDIENEIRRVLEEFAQL